MDAVVDLSWRLYPASLMMLLGALLAVRGTRVEIRAHRLSARDAHKALTFVRGMRLWIQGCAIVALAAAWAWHIGWLGILALVIGAEETLETGIVVFGLTKGKDLRLRP